MFNKKDFINWAQTAQNDNKPMQDFRSSHFNPMKQVQQVDEWVAPAFSTLKAVAVPALKATGKEVGKEVARDVVTGVAKKGVEKVGNKLKPKAKLETEGVKGEIAGGVAGSLAGGALGSALGPVGTVAGGIVGGVAGGAIGNALGGKDKPKKPVQKPVPVHASYDARKEAGMRAFREFFGHQKKLGLGKKQIKQRADQSAAQTGYGGSGTRAFKFGRSVEPKPKPKV